MINVKWKVSPFNDFIFKKLFGTVGNEELLKAFLNAVMKDKNLPLIEEVTIIEKLELEKNHFEEKLGIIDVHAKTDKGEVINIEVQLCNEDNIDKRPLFYWSKLYSSNIKKGQNYEVLPKVITINILNFNYYHEKWVHLFFTPTADVDSNLKMNELEVHFIQLPAFRKRHEKNFKTHELERWLTFLTQSANEEELEEIVAMDQEIFKVYEEIKHLLSDEEVLAVAEAREKQFLDYNSAINHAEARGRQEGVELGIEQGEFNKSIEIAKNSIENGLDDELIVKITGLSIEEIKRLRNELNK